MHKSKENLNGTFSIGKTWNLDDLSHIESYTGPQVSANNREWGGDTGFLVTLGKPYFWQAQTDKEKKFFIASLIKIYGKYTGGKVPELGGFDHKELDQVLGAGRRPGPGPGPGSSAPPPSRPHPLEPTTSQQSVASGNSASSVPPAPLIPPASSNSSTPDPTHFQKIPVGMRPPLNGINSPSASFDSNISRDRMGSRWTNQTNRSQDSVANSFATATTTRTDDTSSQPPRSRNGMNGPGALGRFGDAREPQGPPQEPLPAIPTQGPPEGEGKPPPERRRPPMDPSRPQDRDLVPPPLNSPATRRDPVVPPPRNNDRTSPRKDTSQPPPLARTVQDRSITPVMPSLDKSISDGAKAASILEPTNNSSTSLAAAVASDAASAIEPPPEPQEYTRPGLGPMIRSKKSKGDIAGALWKAASAATAFRPRPGGAGDRLRQTTTKTEGPDGITGVVPAPRRPLTPEIPKPVEAPAEASKQGLATVSAELPAADPSAAAAAEAVPEVTLTIPNSSQATVVKTLQPQETKKEDPPEAAPRRSVVAGNDSKYLQNLGVDASLLDERSEEFGKWLDFFGWVPGQEMRCHSAEEMKVDLEREINRAQAGGWLARFQEEDERVSAIKRGIDLAMGECEELDNLLTLYSVELSVSEATFSNF